MSKYYFMYQVSAILRTAVHLLRYPSTATQLNHPPTL